MITQFEREAAQKLCEMHEQAIIELISLTGFTISDFNLKEVEDARYAIEALQENGYAITEIETDNALEVTYILQQYGKTIAQRDVSLKIEIARG